jgi:hypothetical protein
MPNHNPAHMKLAVWLLWAGWMMPVALVWVWIDGTLSVPTRIRSIRHGSYHRLGHVSTRG